MRSGRGERVVREFGGRRRLEVCDHDLRVTYGAAVAIERFVWTDHALERLHQRRLIRADAERAVERGHETRKPNRGAGDWRVHGQRRDGRRFAVIYDHPSAAISARRASSPFGHCDELRVGLLQ